MSAEIIDRLNYAATLTADARRLGLETFCAPVALTPFCRRPENVFDLPLLIDHDERKFYDVFNMIAKARLSVLTGLDINPETDQEALTKLINDPCSEAINYFPEIRGRQVKGFLFVLSSADPNVGHAFSVIPNRDLPRDMRRDLVKEKACLVIDINLDTLVETIHTKNLTDYVAMYFKDLDYTEAMVILLSDKKVNQGIYIFN